MARTLVKGDEVIVKGAPRGHTTGTFLREFERQVIGHKHKGQSNRYAVYKCDSKSCNHFQNEHLVPFSSIRPKANPRKRKDILAVLALASVLCGVMAQPARADEHSALSNVLLGEQVTDIATSQVIFHKGGFERDPLASKNVLIEVAEAGLVQAFARNPHTSIRFLRGAVEIYPVILVNNFRVMVRISR